MWRNNVIYCLLKIKKCIYEEQFPFLFNRRGHEIIVAMPFKVETDKYTVISSDPNGDIMTTLDTITQPVLQKTDSSGLSISLLNNFNHQIYQSNLLILFVVRNDYRSNLLLLFKVKNLSLTFFVAVL